MKRFEWIINSLSFRTRIKKGLQTEGLSKRNIPEATVGSAAASPCPIARTLPVLLVVAALGKFLL